MMANPNWILKDAALDNVPVWLGIGGPSGSGKTYSALLVAEGMQEVRLEILRRTKPDATLADVPIGVIDTENRRATHYAKEFTFKHLDFRPPFSQERYLDAARFVASQGCRIIIIDSMSHEHEGEGGYLLTHKALLDAMVARRLKDDRETRSEYQLRDALNFSAWIEPAAARTYMIGQLLQIDASFIFCFRAKEKLKITKGKVDSQGFMPIAGDELVYNCVAMAVLPPRSQGVPDWSAKGAKINSGMAQFFPAGKALSRDTGRWLQRWATGEEVNMGAPPRQAAERREPNPKADERKTPPPPEKKGGEDPRALRPMADFKGVNDFLRWAKGWLMEASAAEGEAFDKTYADALKRADEVNGDEAAVVRDLLASAKRGAFEDDAKGADL